MSDTIPVRVVDVQPVYEAILLTDANYLEVASWLGAHSVNISKRDNRAGFVSFDGVRPADDQEHRGGVFATYTGYYILKNITDEDAPVQVMGALRYEKFFKPA